jgi:hypothetical protein
LSDTCVSLLAGKGMKMSATGKTPEYQKGMKKRKTGTSL